MLKANMIYGRDNDVKLCPACYEQAVIIKIEMVDDFKLRTYACTKCDWTGQHPFTGW
jgi:predicted RNA-binding Zn-ribbon protein involved in translation (DUF1610 family)